MPQNVDPPCPSLPGVRPSAPSYDLHDSTYETADSTSISSSSSPPPDVVGPSSSSFARRRYRIAAAAYKNRRSESSSSSSSDERTDEKLPSSLWSDFKVRSIPILSTRDKSSPNARRVHNAT